VTNATVSASPGLSSPALVTLYEMVLGPGLEESGSFTLDYFRNTAMSESERAAALDELQRCTITVSSIGDDRTASCTGSVITQATGAHFSLNQTLYRLLTSLFGAGVPVFESMGSPMAWASLLKKPVRVK